MYKILRDGGVINTLSGQIIRPRTLEWVTIYMPWFRAGNVPEEPDPLPAETPKTLQEEKDIKIEEIEAYAAFLRVKVIKNVSPAELSAWSKKEELARKYSASGVIADAGFLVTEAQNREITLNALVNKIITKADAFWNLESRIAGICGKHTDAVQALTTIPAVRSYWYKRIWPAVLNANEPEPVPEGSVTIGPLPGYTPQPPPPSSG